MTKPPQGHVETTTWNTHFLAPSDYISVELPFPEKGLLKEGVERLYGEKQTNFLSPQIKRQPQTTETILSKSSLIHQ